MNVPQPEDLQDVLNNWIATFKKVIDKTKLPLFVNDENQQVAVGTIEPQTYAASADANLIVSGNIYVTGGATVHTITATSGDFSGNVTASAFYGDGTQLALPASVTSSAFASLTATSLTVDTVTGSSIDLTGNITASTYHGDGSQLSGISFTDASSWTNASAVNFNAGDITASGDLEVTDIDTNTITATGGLITRTITSDNGTLDLTTPSQQYVRIQNVRNARMRLVSDVDNNGTSDDTSITFAQDGTGDGTFKGQIGIDDSDSDKLKIQAGGSEGFGAPALELINQDINFYGTLTASGGIVAVNISALAGQDINLHPATNDEVVIRSDNFATLRLVADMDDDSTSREPSVVFAMDATGDGEFHGEIGINAGDSNKLVIQSSGSKGFAAPALEILAQDVTALGTTTFIGAVDCDSTLNVDGTAFLGGAVTADSTLRVDGNTVLGGTLDIVNNVTAGSELTVDSNFGIGVDPSKDFDYKGSAGERIIMDQANAHVAIGINASALVNNTPLQINGDNHASIGFRPTTDWDVDDGGIVVQYNRNGDTVFGILAGVCQTSALANGENISIGMAMKDKGNQAGEIQFWTNDTTAADLRFTISSGGLVNIMPHNGSTTPDVELEVSDGATQGGGTIHRASSGTHSSKKRKKNIKHLKKTEESQAISDIKALRPCTFQYLESDKTRKGYILEEAPESIKGDHEDIMIDDRIFNLECAMRVIIEENEQLKAEVKSLKNA